MAFPLVHVIAATVATVGTIALEQLTQMAKDAVRDKVKPIKGSIVKCDLAVGLDHSGVYVGDERIAHRDGGGHIELVSPKDFVSRLGGRNPTSKIYVSCCGQNAVGSTSVAERALEAYSFRKDKTEQLGYNLIFKNCHHFSQHCLTGLKSDKQGTMDFTFTSLEKTLKDEYGFNMWRLWDFQ